MILQDYYCNGLNYVRSEMGGISRAWNNLEDWRACQFVLFHNGEKTEKPSQSIAKVNVERKISIKVITVIIFSEPPGPHCVGTSQQKNSRRRGRGPQQPTAPHIKSRGSWKRMGEGDVWLATTSLRILQPHLTEYFAVHRRCPLRPTSQVIYISRVCVPSATLSSESSFTFSNQ